MPDFEIVSARDLIYLQLPDNREVIGRALIVQEQVHWPGGHGTIQCQFVIEPQTPEMDMCVVLMKLDQPIRERIIL